MPIGIYRQFGIASCIIYNVFRVLLQQEAYNARKMKDQNLKYTKWQDRKTWDGTTQDHYERLVVALLFSAGLPSMVFVNCSTGFFLFIVDGGCDEQRRVTLASIINALTRARLAVGDLAS